MSWLKNGAPRQRVNKVVLDASAVLAVLFKETGAEIVAQVLFGATISAVNYSEVLKKAVEKRGDIHKAKHFLDRQSLKVVAFDISQAVAAAAILPQTSDFGLSFADRACVSLGLQLQYQVLTAEKRMSLTGLDVKIRLIRKMN